MNRIVYKYISKIYHKIIEHWEMLMFLIIGFVIRLFLTRYQVVVSYDEVNYLKLAVYGALHGITNVMHPYWSPFYPFIIALFSKITANYEFIARLISVLCGSLVILPVYKLARYRLTKKTSIITIAMIAVYPALSLLSTKILTEPLYIFLGMSGILIVWYSLTKKSIGLSFCGGVIFGMTYLTRPEGIGFTIVVIIIYFILLINSVFQRKKNKYIQLIIFSVLGFIIISSPYLLYLHQKTGEWTISAKQKSLQQAEADVFKHQKEDYQFRKLSADNKSLLIDQMFHLGNFITAEEERGESVVQVTLFLMVQKYIKNIHELINMIVPTVIPLTLAVFLILGLFCYTVTKEKILFDLYLLSFIIFFWCIVIPLFHINYRYFLPLLPICFIWIGKGVVVFYSWAKNFLNYLIVWKKKNFFIQVISILLAVFLISLSYLPDYVRIFSDNTAAANRWAKPVEYKRAGMWLKNNCKTAPVIMSHYQIVSYYAGNYDITESVSIPFNRINRILEYAQHRNVDYIVLSERYVKLFPLIENLFYMKNIPEQLKVVYHFESKAGLRVVIYKLMHD